MTFGKEKSFCFGLSWACEWGTATGVRRSNWNYLEMKERILWTTTERKRIDISNLKITININGKCLPFFNILLAPLLQHKLTIFKWKSIHTHSNEAQIIIYNIPATIYIYLPLQINESASSLRRMFTKNLINNTTTKMNKPWQRNCFHSLWPCLSICSS